MLKRIIEILKEKKAKDIVTIDMRESDIPVDYFVVATGGSSVHVKTLFDELLHQMKKEGVRSYHNSLDMEATWGVVDFIDVVVHIFQPETRVFYDLESLWSDMPQIKEKEDDL